MDRPVAYEFGAEYLSIPANSLVYGRRDRIRNAEKNEQFPLLNNQFDPKPAKQRCRVSTRLLFELLKRILNGPWLFFCVPLSWKLFESKWVSLLNPENAENAE